MLNGHEATLLSRFLNDATAINKYPLLKPEHFGSSVHREIFNAILVLHYDGKQTTFNAVEDYLRGRGRLAAIGEHTLSTLAGDTRIAAMGDDNFNYALGEVTNAYRERAELGFLKERIAGKITTAELRAKLDEIQKNVATEPSWQDALNESVITSSELSDLKLTPRRKLLGDWFCEGDLGFIFAFRGVGKTWLALAISQALSTGGSR